VELGGRTILVIGMGRTGTAVVDFLARRGARVLATDETPPERLAGARDLLSRRDGDVAWVPYEASVLAAGVDLVVPSPGVPPRNPLLVAAAKQGIPIWSEIELAFAFLKTPVIAVTGTNGKTTTTTLIGDILAKGGKRVFVGGNIGNPLVEYAGGPQGADLAVVEVSSFQLQWTRTFHPFVAVHLNLTADHYDYHGSLAAYGAAKEKIFANQTPRDFAVVNADDAGTAPLVHRLSAVVIPFSSKGPLAGRGAYLEGERIVLSLDGSVREAYPTARVRIPGRHNLENIMAAVAVGRICGCPPEAVLAAVEGFEGIPHRIEYAGRVRGVTFYDDSKGTNVDAVRRALETFSDPVILLMGGRDKEGDFEGLREDVKRRVKALVLFGEARGRIESALGGLVPTLSLPTLGEAVKRAFHEAAEGDTVLLSPGCASFDAFRDYRARGDYFKEVVRELEGDVQPQGA